MVRNRDIPLWRFLSISKDPNLFATLLEDIGAMIGLGIGLIAMRRPGVTNRRQLVIVVTLAAGLYGFAAATVVDVLFDAGKPSVFQPRVTAKHVNQGRTNDYYLDLDPWGPRQRPNEVKVTSSVYARVQPGDTVCVSLHPGALSLPWYVTDLCPAHP